MIAGQVAAEGSPAMWDTRPVFLALLVLLFAARGASQDTPLVAPGAVANNASYRADGLPDAGVARGSMIAVFGQRLGPEAPAYAESLSLPTVLGGTQIQIQAGGQVWTAPLLFSAANQVAAILPSGVPAGDATLTVRRDGATSDPVAISVMDHAFGIFTRNQAGSGPAVVQNWNSPGDQPVNAIINAAHPGQVMVLWGTGLGPIDGDDAGAPPVGNLPVAVEVWVGDRRAEVLYAGRSSGFPGIDQINFVVPDGVTGCYVPVVVIAGGVSSNYATIAVTKEGAVCSDPYGFMQADLETAVAKGELRTGVVALNRLRAVLYQGNDETPVNIDSASGSFHSYHLSSLPATLGIRELIAPLGACAAYGMRLNPNGEISTTPDDPLGGRQLRAGDQLTIEGTNGAKTIEWDGDYEGNLGGGMPGEEGAQPVFLTPGTYTLRGGAAGGDVGPFTATIELTPGINWRNEAQVSEVRRDQDLTLMWTGGDASKEFVFIAGESVNKDDGVGGSFVCAAPVEAGRFTVPSRILRLLPSNSDSAASELPTGLLFLGTGSWSARGRFSAPGLDGGYFGYWNQRVRNVDFR